MLKNYILRLSKIFIILSLALSCSGISLINGKKSFDHLYSKEFLEKIGSIKEIYRSGNPNGALKELNLLQSESLSEIERAMRQNLIGVIFFSIKNYEKGLFHFNLALRSSNEDPHLTSQIFLNMASSFYVLGRYREAKDHLGKVQEEYFEDVAEKKFYMLDYKVSQELNDNMGQVIALLGLFNRKEQLSEIRSDSYFDILLTLFLRLDKSKRDQILTDFENTNSLVVGYMAYLYSENLYFKGSKDLSLDVLEWIQDNFGSFNELERLTMSFKKRVESVSKLNEKVIGVVLPLSGKKKKYGKRALVGIDVGLKRLFPGQNISFKVKDSEGSGILGALRVKDLVEHHNVAAVIGGLFPQEAEKEFLEAKKNGVLFVSLSQVNLPKQDKNPLMVEIPGSIESIVETILSESFLKKFGDRGGLVFPNTDRGRTFSQEFWRKAELNNVKINGIQKYNEGHTDYRVVIEKLLGLQYTNVRKEEFELLKEIRELEGKRTLKRYQVLKPSDHFDWVFIPALPREAIQIIPSFEYFDAYKLPLIGGPSWRSRALYKESFKTKRLFLVGDDSDNLDEDFIRIFLEKYKKRPKLIEIRSFDAVKIIYEIMSGQKFSNRDDLAFYIQKKGIIKGISGVWKLKENTWIKDLDPVRFYRGKMRTAL